MTDERKKLIEDVVAKANERGGCSGRPGCDYDEDDVRDILDALDDVQGTIPVVSTSVRPGYPSPPEDDDMFVTPRGVVTVRQFLNGAIE